MHWEPQTGPKQGMEVARFESVEHPSAHLLREIDSRVETGGRRPVGRLLKAEIKV